MIRKNDITEGIYIKDGFTISSASIAIRSNNSIVTPGTGTMSIDFTFDDITTRYKVDDTHTQLTVGEFVRISSENTISNRSIEVHKDDIIITGLGEGFVFAGPGGSLYTTMTASAAPAGPAGPQGPTGPSITGPTGPAGATGPSIVSTDFGNIAEIGSDGYIYVPSIPATQSYDDGSDSVKSVYVATTTVLTRTPTYNNGTSGVGATLTSTSNGTMGTIDGVVMDNSRLGERVLVKNQTSQLENGIYVLTTVGSATQSYVLTRSDDSDETDEFDSQVVTSVFGTNNKGRLFGQTTNQPTVGTSSIVYTQTNSVYISQQTSGTQSNYQIPIYTGTARQLTKGTAKFKYDYLTNRITINGDSLLFPATNSVGNLSNDGTGVLSWTSSTSGGSVAIDANQIPFGTGVGITSSNIFIINPSDGSINLGNNTMNVSAYGSSITGRDNTMLSSNSSSILGGQNNLIGATFGNTGYNNTITGGSNNVIKPLLDSDYVRNNSITGGYLNSIRGNSRNNSITGGYFNSINGYSRNSSILNGYNNFINNSRNSSIVGSYNSILNDNIYSSIISGISNQISNNRYSSILGGRENIILNDHPSYFTSRYNNIIGGRTNKISSTALNGYPQTITNSLILGGENNYVNCEATESSGSGTFVKRSIIIGGSHSIIGGYSPGSGGIFVTDIEDSSIISSVNSYIGGSVKRSVIIGGIGSRIGASNVFGVGEGLNNMILSSSGSSIINNSLGINGSVIIGGQNLTLTTSNTVYVPTLKIDSVTQSTSNDKVLVWGPTKNIEYVSPDKFVSGGGYQYIPDTSTQIATMSVGTNFIFFEGITLYGRVSLGNPQDYVNQGSIKIGAHSANSGGTYILVGQDGNWLYRLNGATASSESIITTGTQSGQGFQVDFLKDRYIEVKAVYHPSFNQYKWLMIAGSTASYQA